MTKLTSLAARVRLLLNDPDAARFSEILLTNAIRQSLELIDTRVPQILIMEVALVTTGRDQELTGLTGCLFLVKVVIPNPSSICELEPGTHFLYQVDGGIPTLHFLGDLIPPAGTVLQVHYAAASIIEGLDGAAATTLPEMCEPALVNGAAGYAFALRAASLVESYGTRAEDAARLMETSRVFMEHFDQMLKGLKLYQEFGFPPGVALDAWDSQGRKHANPRS
jgi:hypothetical protein